MHHTWLNVALIVCLLWDPVRSLSAQQKLQQLLELSASSVNPGLLVLKEDIFEEIVRHEPRPYKLMLLITQLKGECKPCKLLHEEVKLLAGSIERSRYTSVSPTGTLSPIAVPQHELFVIEVDASNSKQRSILRELGIRSVPHLIYIPKGNQYHETPTRASQSWKDLLQLRFTLQAYLQEDGSFAFTAEELLEDLSAQAPEATRGARIQRVAPSPPDPRQVSQKLDTSSPLHSDDETSKFMVLAVTNMLLVGSGLSLLWSYGRDLAADRVLQLAFSCFVFIFCVSGGLHSFARGRMALPLSTNHRTADTSVWLKRNFQPTPQDQLTGETYIVGMLLSFTSLALYSLHPDSWLVRACPNSCTRNAVVGICLLLTVVCWRQLLACFAYKQADYITVVQR